MIHFTKYKVVLFFTFLCFVHSSLGQEVPGDYQDVLKTSTERAISASVEGQHSTERFEDDSAGISDADAVRIRRLDRLDQGCGRNRPDDGRFGSASGGSQSDHVRATRQRNRRDRTSQPLLLGRAHVYYMHVHGMGKSAYLARRVKPGLDLIGHVKPEAAAAASSGGAALDTAKIAKIVGHDGEQSGAVYKITIGRDDLSMKERGAVINARMGLNTWAAFAGTQEDAVIAGDVAMLENEVTPVLRALRKSGLDVVAIHHHMTGDRPMVIFLHYWGRGPVDKLATGFKSALDELGKGVPVAGGAH
jgi:hypothetical protein